LDDPALVSVRNLVQFYGVMTNAEIAAALDSRHAAANAAFVNKDIATYEDLFGRDLQYRQVNGTTIDRLHLMRDVQRQFALFRRADSHFVRENLQSDAEGVRETLLQTAIAEVVAFGFLRRVWRVERRGCYTWAIEDGKWKIVRVDVLDETVRGSLKLGR
jgi:hypothetical protein